MFVFSFFTWISCSYFYFDSMVCGFIVCLFVNLLLMHMTLYLHHSYLVSGASTMTSKKNKGIHITKNVKTMQELYNTNRPHSLQKALPSSGFLRSKKDNTPPNCRENINLVRGVNPFQKIFVNGEVVFPTDGGCFVFFSKSNESIERTTPSQGTKCPGAPHRKKKQQRHAAYAL